MMRERYCANAKGFPGVDRPLIHVSAKNCIQYFSHGQTRETKIWSYRENRISLRSKRLHAV